MASDQQSGSGDTAAAKPCVVSPPELSLPSDAETRTTAIATPSPADVARNEADETHNEGTSTGFVALSAPGSEMPPPQVVSTQVYQPEWAVISVGKELLEVDLRACAPWAVVFTIMRRRWQAGLPPIDGAIFLAKGTSGCNDERADTQACAPAADTSMGNAASGGAQEAHDEADGEEGESADKQPCNDVDLHFPTFPGGMPVLRSIVRYLEVFAAEERAAGENGAIVSPLKVDVAAYHLDFTCEKIWAFLEAAATLRCPRILRETVLAPAAKELPSRRVFALLERLVQYTADTFEDLAPDELSVIASRLPVSVAGSPISPPERQPSLQETAVLHKEEKQEFVTRAQVVQAFCQAIQRLCARLDAVDFRLSPSLALGSPWASLEVLRAYRVKVENMGRVNYALQSMTSTIRDSTAKLFFYEEERPGRQSKQQEWKEHQFALHVFRKHLIESMLYSNDAAMRTLAERSLLERQEDSCIDVEGDNASLLPASRGESEDDVPEVVCDGVTNECLVNLAGFVGYCEAGQTPPGMAATMVRALLLTDQKARARALFEAIFVRSRKVQDMVVAGQIPVDFLCSVKTHRIASVVLKRLVGRHEMHSKADLSHVLEHILLDEFRSERYCQELIMNSAVARDLTVYCRVSTRSVAHLEDPPSLNNSAEKSTGFSLVVVDADVLRLRKAGQKLFAAVFVTHAGFLPAAEEESHERQDLNWTTAECPWDNGDLDLPLLRHVPQTDEALHLSRRVLLRGLLRRQRAGVESDVPTTVRHWELGRWPLCREAGLIAEAFAFLGSCWRGLRADGAARPWPTQTADASAVEARLQNEEAVFQMFSDLEFWRLQPRDLLTPWVPPHLLACHLASSCKLLDEHQRAIAEENRQNLLEINRLRQRVRQLVSKLEAVDARSVHCVEKQAEVGDTLRTLR
eukprot:TRINITY_DN55948_c0_g1_i1.p1 TRINITY_DN55948_c0_g1~~TRINITY_DN55948_c0_g1_i1.p1  ORF type:complete len:918 (-),score=168.44 TRINITY_DN55948_c0_g1_i1:29-2782(-)